MFPEGLLHRGDGLTLRAAGPVAQPDQHDATSACRLVVLRRDLAQADIDFDALDLARLYFVHVEQLHLFQGAHSVRDWRVVSTRAEENAAPTERPQRLDAPILRQYHTGLPRPPLVGGSARPRGYADYQPTRPAGTPGCHQEG